MEQNNLKKLGAASFYGAIEGVDAAVTYTLLAGALAHTKADFSAIDFGLILDYARNNFLTVAGVAVGFGVASSLVNTGTMLYKEKTDLSFDWEKASNKISSRAKSFATLGAVGVNMLIAQQASHQQQSQIEELQRNAHTVTAPVKPAKQIDVTSTVTLKLPAAGQR